MATIPDFPGKSLVEGTTKGARLLAVGVGAGVAAAGGFLLKRVLGHGGGAEQTAEGDPIAQTPTAPPGAATASAPKPPVVKPTPAKPKAAPKRKTAPVAKKPPKTTGTDAPPKPQFEPGNISGDKNPHRALNNPVVDPDPTEYPDPFEKREDPRDPVDPDAMSFGEEPHAPTGAGSTSEPHPRDDLEAGDRAEPPERENLDD
jgi:hypothetical protein